MKRVLRVSMRNKSGGGLSGGGAWDWFIDAITDEGESRRKTSTARELLQPKV